MERKYFTEFGLNVYTSFKAFVPLEQVDGYEDGHDYNIYIITSSPRAYFVKDSLEVNQNTLNVSFEFRNEDRPVVIEAQEISLFPEFIDNEKLTFELIHNNEFIKITADENYIRDAFQKNGIGTSGFKFSEGKYICRVECEVLWQRYCCQKNIPKEYEILYVGQAYGSDGSRNAQERLRSHSTLQKILIDFSVSRREERLFVLLFELNILNQLSMDGLNNNAVTTHKEDKEHIAEIFDHTHEFKQIINIFEAALINYFKPPFNSMYINNFPDTNHIGYQDYFSLDYNKLIAEIDLEFDNSPWIVLKTENVQLDNFNRFIEYKLYNDPNRKDMLDIFQSSEG